jgi:hypothetical protein
MATYPGWSREFQQKVLLTVSSSVILITLLERQCPARIFDDLSQDQETRKQEPPDRHCVVLRLFASAQLVARFTTQRPFQKVNFAV